MDEQELAALEDPSTWDDETAEVLPPAEDPRVVVPIRFTPEEFSRVARYARATGLPLTRCIHDAVLERAGDEVSIRGHRVGS